MLTRIAAILTLALAPALAFAEVGEDGLHKQPFHRVTFKDMAEDLADAKAENKRLAIIWEQRGCIYCRKLNEEVFTDPEVRSFIEDNYFVVQMNLFGDEEVTDFDGETLPEKEMAKRWGVVFTPTIMFMPDEVPEGGTAAEAAVSVMPGAFGKWTTLNMFRWVKLKGYETGEHFQKFHAREFEKQRGG
ncbi:MAG: thioredoxin [Alphaproteobacteria bacterium]|nr:MAG: thioredoxin [Alphaproteobacteria bacterium]